MKRRGFTLIELVVSLGIVGILAMALGSTVTLSLRALPTPGGGPETQASAGRALQIIGSDIELASTVAMPDVRTLTLTIPDQTGDASAETVTYAWAGSSGDPLTRTFNADTVTLLPSVVDLKYVALKSASVTTDLRTTTPADRISITMAVGSSETVDAQAIFRLFNARAP